MTMTRLLGGAATLAVMMDDAGFNFIATFAGLPGRRVSATSHLNSGMPTSSAARTSAD
jgi:hypothetical protein